MAVLGSRLIAVGALLATATSAQDCDYSEGVSCINAEASASVKIDFGPLFSSPPTFVFGIDDLDDQDIQDIVNEAEYLDAPLGDEPAQAVAWWFEYDNDTVNLNPSQERVYTAWALESNSSNDIGGSDGGCENLLGAECVSDLKSLFTGISDQIDDNLAEFFQSPPDRINCPNVLWNDGSGRNSGGTAYSHPLWGHGQWFARMSDSYLWTSEPPPSGNASSTHGVPQMRYRSFEEQKSISVIAFTLGSSLSGGGRDNVTINMACLRVGEAPKEEEEEEEEEDDTDNAAAGKSVISTVIVGFIAVLSAFMI